jgi:hypothetical protein
MSGDSYQTDCPNCGGDLHAYADRKPFNFVTAECMDCGFYYTVKTGQMSLKTLNDWRGEMKLPPLKRRKHKGLDPDLEW